MGVPMIGCSCQICCSLHPRNKRLRSSILLETDEGAWIVDVGPDFRQQVLSKNLPAKGKGSLLGVILTHAHSDHTAGLDDLRVFNFGQKRALPLILSESCFSDISTRYAYMFEAPSSQQSARAALRPWITPYLDGAIEVEGLRVCYNTHYQGSMPVLGLRIGDFAYLTDIKEYGLQLLALVKGVDTLIMSAGRLQAVRMHMTFEESIDLAKKIGARRTVFTHMDHDIDYPYWENRLPEGMSLGYDGMEIDLSI